jgi:uncharacterized membrane protein
MRFIKSTLIFIGVFLLVILAAALIVVVGFLTPIFGTVFVAVGIALLLAGLYAAENEDDSKKGTD